MISLKLSLITNNYIVEWVMESWGDMAHSAPFSEAGLEQ